MSPVDAPAEMKPGWQNRIGTLTVASRGPWIANANGNSVPIQNPGLTPWRKVVGFVG